MTDHANELRRYSRKIGHPAGDVPSVMLAAAGEIERLAARLEAAEKERDECNRRRLEAADHFAAQTALMKQKYDDLRVKVAEMERQEPVGKFVQHPSNGLWEQDGYGDNPDANPLYALPGVQAQPTPSVPAVTATAYRWRYRGAIMWQYGELTEKNARLAEEHNHEVQPLYAEPISAQSAPSIRPAALSPVINWLRNGCDPMKAADELEMLASQGAKPCP